MPLTNPVKVYDRLQRDLVEAFARIDEYDERRARLVSRIASIQDRLDVLDAKNADDLNQVVLRAGTMRKKLKVPSGDIGASHVVAFVNTWKEENATDTAAKTDALVKRAEG